jgi:sec-independent protein translocase protein TatA
MLVIGVAAILFGGRGRLSGVMGDFAKGIKAFKSGLKEDDEPVHAPPQVAPPPASVSTAAREPSAQDR